MKTVAVVPVKSLEESKSRLGGALDAEERVQLAVGMLAHVLQVVAASGAVEAIAIVSPEPETLSLPPGTLVIKQQRAGLNNSLEQARDWALDERADALLVLFADLPLLKPEDVSAICALGAEEGTVVLAPDWRGEGTNAMLAHPPSLARFAFGVRSFDAHREAVRQAGAVLQVYRSTGTALDIDGPDDLERLAHEKAQELREAPAFSHFDQ